jgi:hypothetical protein
MKRKSLMLAVVLGLLILTVISAEAQSGLAGRWTEEGGCNACRLIISSVSGNYVAVYVMGQMTCRFNQVIVSGNSINMSGGYVSGDGFYTYLYFNLKLSDDGITLTGTKRNDTHWTNRKGQALHNDETTAILFTR